MTKIEHVDITAAKRLCLEGAVDDDWFHGDSPRNGPFGLPEGSWCHWVHLARLILAHELTQDQMPEFHLPYDAPHIYSDHHPSCPRGQESGG